MKNFRIAFFCSGNGLVPAAEYVVSAPNMQQAMLLAKFREDSPRDYKFITADPA